MSTASNAQVTSPVGSGVISSADDPTSPNYTSSSASAIPAAVRMNADWYWAAQPYPAQALRQAGPQAQRTGTANTFQPIADKNVLYQTAVTLAMKGYKIDPLIMAYGTDPIVAMLDRMAQGITYVAPLLIASPDALDTPFNPTMNPGPGVDVSQWIKVSLDPNDYPQKYPYIQPPNPTVGQTAGPIIGAWRAPLSAAGAKALGIDNLAPKGGQIYGPGIGAPAAFNSGQILPNTLYTDPASSKPFVVYETAGSMGMMLMFILPNA